jgi:hypothetical protein
VPTAVEATQAGPGGAHAFGQGALRYDFKFDLAGVVLFLENKRFLGPRKGADQLRDAAFVHQARQTGAAGAGVVADHREAAHAAVAHPVDEEFRHARLAEAGDQDRGAVLYIGDRICQRIGALIFHIRTCTYLAGAK